MENKISSSIIGGIAGTAVITAMMLLANALGLQGIDFGKMLADFTHTTPIIGWVMHFLMGTLLAFVYVYFFRDEFQAPYPIRGVIYSIIPFVVTMIILFPMSVMSAGKTIDSPGVFIIATMLAYFAYGYVMGLIAKPKSVTANNTQHAPLT